MPPSPLTRRAQILEEKVERLERLPARIDAIELQILQFRDEVRREFSETREELRGEMRELHAQAIDRISLTEQALLHEISRLDERAASRDVETRRVMRVLYEDLIARIATIGEGGRRPE